MKMAISTMVVIVPYMSYEKGQNRTDLNRKEAAGLNQSIPMISNCWHAMLRKRLYARVIRKDEKSLSTSTLIRIRFEKGRPPEDLGCKQEKIKRIKCTGNIYC